MCQLSDASYELECLEAWEEHCALEMLENADTDSETIGMEDTEVHHTDCLDSSTPQWYSFRDGVALLGQEHRYTLEYTRGRLEIVEEIEEQAQPVYVDGNLLHIRGARFIRRYIHPVTASTEELRMCAECLKYQTYRSKYELTSAITQQLNRLVRVDKLDIEVHTTAEDNVFTHLSDRIRAVFPDTRRYNKTRDDGSMYMSFTDKDTGKTQLSVNTEEYIDGQGVKKHRTRIRSSGHYAQVGNELFRKIFGLGASLAEPNMRDASVLSKKVCNSVPIKVGQYAGKLVFSGTSLVVLKQCDIAIDIVNPAHSYDSITKLALDGRQRYRGRKPTLTYLGDSVTGRTLYFGKGRGMNTVCIYEKCLQSREKFHQLVHTRIEYRLRPKRNKNMLPEIAALMSPMEILFRSTIAMHVMLSILC